jgi:hypothetical protein
MVCVPLHRHPLHAMATTGFGSWMAHVSLGLGDPSQSYWLARQKASHQKSCSSLIRVAQSCLPLHERAWLRVTSLSFGLCPAMGPSWAPPNVLLKSSRTARLAYYYYILRHGHIALGLLSHLGSHTIEAPGGRPGATNLQPPMRPHTCRVATIRSWPQDLLATEPFELQRGSI